MEQHNHGHVFREKDIDRVLATYGNKPGKNEKQKLDAHLLAQQDKFIEINRIREAKKNRQRGQSR
ncbi:hypothetical protein MLD52_07995 [Puniceicoccaceae bacterium K14]|nr:hypothetical protein [Puniceicoccaceae bacterium K14]